MPENTPPETVFDEEKAFAELEAFIDQHEADKSKIHALLTIQDHQFLTKKFKWGTEEVDIRIRASIPYDQRTKALEIQRKIEELAATGEEVTPLEIQKPMYEAIASLCIDAPWNDWKVWWFVDKKSGSAPQVLRDFIKLIDEGKGGIEKFRPKR